MILSQTSHSSHASKHIQRSTVQPSSWIIVRSSSHPSRFRYFLLRDAETLPQTVPNLERVKEEPTLVPGHVVRRVSIALPQRRIKTRSVVETIV